MYHLFAVHSCTRQFIQTCSPFSCLLKVRKLQDLQENRFQIPFQLANLSDKSSISVISFYNFGWISKSQRYSKMTAYSAHDRTLSRSIFNIEINRSRFFERTYFNIQYHQFEIRILIMKRNHSHTENEQKNSDKKLETMWMPYILQRSEQETY